MVARVVVLVVDQVSGEFGYMFVGYVMILVVKNRGVCKELPPSSLLLAPCSLDLGGRIDRITTTCSICAYHIYDGFSLQPHEVTRYAV